MKNISSISQFRFGLRKRRQKPRRCSDCNRILRDWKRNQSGLCESCLQKTYGPYPKKKKAKVYKYKCITNNMIKGNFKKQNKVIITARISKEALIKLHEKKVNISKLVNALIEDYLK